MPPGPASSGPRHEPTVAPAPIGPVSIRPPMAASQAARPSAGPGRTEGSPTPRSNSTTPTTIGTGPARVGKPTPCSARAATTPSQAANPKAEPPVSTTASTRCTRRSGERRSHSRVPGAPPLTSPEATAPSGSSTTVHPVRARASVQWPTRTPGTSVSTGAGAGGAPGVAAGHPGAQRRDHLVADGSEEPGPVLRRHRFVALPADEHDLVADGHVGARAAVDHELVHGDHASDRPPPAAHEDGAAGLLQPAGPAVGVAQGDGGHHRLLGQGVAPAVGDALAGGQPAHVGHPGLQLQGGTQADQLGPGTVFGRRRVAVEGDAGADQVVAAGRAQDGPGGGGG